MNGVIIAKNDLYGKIKEDVKPTIQEYMASDFAKKQLKALLKDRAGYFMMAISQIVEGNPQLQNVEPQSIFNAAMVSAVLNLPIEKNLGFSYIVPYKDKAQFQLGYKGYIQLALRTGQYKYINSVAIKEGEIISNNLLTGELELKFVQDIDLRDTLKTVGYASYIEFNNGFRNTLYMSVQQIINHASKYSKTYNRDIKNYTNTSVWSTNFDAMALKTVLKLNLSKFGALSVEVQKALQLDGTIINNIDDKGVIQAEYTDNTEEKAFINNEIPDVKPNSEDMQKLFKLANNKNIDVCKKAKEMFGMVNLNNLNMTQYEMLTSVINK